MGSVYVIKLHEKSLRQGWLASYKQLRQGGRQDLFPERASGRTQGQDSSCPLTLPSSEIRRGELLRLTPHLFPSPGPCELTVEGHLPGWEDFPDSQRDSTQLCS